MLNTGLFVTFVGLDTVCCIFSTVLKDLEIAQYLPGSSLSQAYGMGAIQVVCW